MSILETGSGGRVGSDAEGGSNGGLAASVSNELLNLRASLEYQIRELDRCIELVNGDEAQKRDYLMQQIENERMKRDLEVKLNSSPEIDNHRQQIEDLRMEEERKVTDLQVELNALVQLEEASPRTQPLENMKMALQHQERIVIKHLNALAKREIGRGVYEFLMLMIETMREATQGQERMTNSLRQMLRIRK